MVSREQKNAALHEKLQLLRSITNSRSMNQNSIILDASKYIEELKRKVEMLDNGKGSGQSSSHPHQTPFPVVTVQALEKGFLIDVRSEKSFPGSLVSILEVFEQLRLNVVEARVSCTESFQLQAVGQEDGGEDVSAEVVKQAVLQALNESIQNNDPQD